MKRRILSFLLTIAMVVTMVPAFSVTAIAATPDAVTTTTVGDYTIVIPKGVEVPEASDVTPTPVTVIDTTWGDDGNKGWYVVDSDVTITSTVTVAGDVKLILADGAALTVTGETNKAGIQVTDDNKLTIYGQTGGTGKLIATGGTDAAGIGGNKFQAGQNITINGGTVTAIGNGGGAGIGGGNNGDSGDITINFGDVTAKSNGTGAGIGSGSNAKAVGTIRINGGNVTATGGGTQNNCAKKNGTGCAIGCGACDGDMDKPNSGWINAVYVSTALSARFSYNDGGTYSQSITPYTGNWAKDDTYNENYSKWRDVKITSDVVSNITVGAQTAVPEYGTASTSTYDVTTEYVSGSDWSILWHKDGVSTEAPASYSVTGDSNAKKLYLDYNGTADAGVYTFTLSCDGVTADEATYTVDKCPATITSGSAAKVYDGTPLTCEDYEVSGFLDGQGVRVTCEGSCTGAGSADNEFSYTEKEGTNLGNYAITVTKGTLTVTNDLFVVTAGNYNAEYDGTEHKFNDEADGTKVKVTAKNGIDYTGFATLAYQTSETGEQGSWSDWSTSVPGVKNAGKLYVKVRATATVNGQEATIESDVYTMEVTKKPVVLKSESKQREYNGTPLSDAVVSWGALAGGESFEIDPIATGTMTKVGSVSNTIDISGLKVKRGSVDTTANYTFTKEEGTLTVTPNSTPITITTDSSTKKYDGTVLDAGTATYTQGILVSGESLNVTLYRTDEFAVKDAGIYKNHIAAYQVTDVNGEDVTNCYTFAEPNIGTLTITPRQVTLTSGSDRKIYSGAGDSAFNYSVNASGDAILQGEGLEYSGFKTITEASYTQVENTFTYQAASGSAFNPDNYEITVNYGRLALVPEMAIFAEDLVFTYDGTAHQANAIVVDTGVGAAVETTYATSADGKEYSAYSTAIPTITDAGTLYIKVRAIKGTQEKDESYTVTVEKRNVIISTDSATKSYDGNALTVSGYAFSGDGFADGEGAVVTVTGTQTQAGSSDNSFSYTLNAGTKQDNYTITEEPGTLTVTPHASVIAITTGSSTAAYNGSPLACSDWSATFSGETVTPAEGTVQTVLPDTGDTLIVCCTAAITDAGSVENACTYRVEQKDTGKDITSSYTFAEPVCGTLTVTPRSVVINTKSATKVYDGEALTNNYYTVTGDNFIYGQGFETVNVVGSRTNAGTTENILGGSVPYTFKDGTNPDNYEVTVVPGTLTVTKRRVIVSSGSAVETTSDAPASNTDVRVEGDGFVEGELSDGYPKAIGSQSAIGESSNYIDYSWQGDGNPANYIITENRGKLLVTNDGSIPVAVVTGYSGTYDGEYHTGSVIKKDASATVMYSDDGGKTYTLSEAPKYKDAGTYTVYARITAQSGGGSSDYTFQVQIAPRSVSLVSSDASKTYDGTALTGTSADVTGTNGFVDGEFDKVTMIGSRTDVGSAANTFDVVLKAGVKENNYNISKTYGTLTVTKRPVTVVSGSAVKSELAVMSSGPAINPEIKVSGYGFVAGELQEGYPKATATRSDIGESVNAIQYKWNEGFSSENYAITEIPGTLKVVQDGELAAVITGYEGVYDGQEHTGSVATVKDGMTVEYSTDGGETWTSEVPKFKNFGTSDVMVRATDASASPTNIQGSYTVIIHKRQATISSGSASKTYDGNALTCADFKTDGFVSGEGATVTVTGSLTNVGTGENSFSYVLTDGTRDDNYEITELPGTLTVNKCQVTVTSGSAVKSASVVTATGSATNAEITVSGDGFVQGELKENYPKATGSQSEVGESSNTIEYAWKEGFSAGNYEITENFGKLVVAEDKEAALVATGYEGIYDGQEHTGSVATVKDGMTVEYSTDGGETWTSEVPKFKNFGTSDVMVQATDAEGSTYNATYTVEIKKRSLILTAGSATKVYDGTILTCEDYTVGGDGFAAGEEQTITMTEDSYVQDVHMIPNVIRTLSDNGNFKKDNYDITYVNGELTVTKRPLILYSESISALYDGETHSSSTIIEVGKGQTEDLAKIPDMGFANGEGATYTDLSTYKDANTYMNTFKVNWKNGTEKENYDYKIIYGVVDIDPRKVTFTSASDSKEYDGTALTNGTVTVTGDGFVSGEGVEFDVTGSQTEVGSSDNVFDYGWKAGTKDSNYDVTSVYGTLTVDAAPSEDSYNDVILYSVGIQASVNGTVTAGPMNTSENAKVTLTVKADEGYALDTLSVTLKSGKEVSLTTVTLGEKYTFRMPAGNVTVKATFKEAKAAVNNFTDIKESDYFYDAVLWATTNGITNGVDETHFDPKAPTTRGQMITFLWRCAGCPEPTVTETKFTDLKATQYYYKAVLWAVENGITSGTTETTFEPNAPLTRAQAVTFLWRYEGSASAVTTDVPFTDLKKTQYYYDAVLWAAEQGISSGTTEDTFSPQDGCIRAQAVTFLYRNMGK